MAKKKKELSQNRREAAAWAQDWAIRNRNRKFLIAGGVIVAVVCLGLLVNFIIVKTTRSTFSSVEEMRAAVQGRYVYDKYEDIVIQGDEIEITYYELSHYNADYAERYGYSEYGDSVYQDIIEEWDYRHGVIRCHWMEDIPVDKDGHIRYYEMEFVKTDKPKPVPLDPDQFKKAGEDADLDDEAEGLTPEELESQQDVQENLEETEEKEEAAVEAGLISAGDSK